MITVFLDSVRISDIPSEIVKYLKLMDEQRKRSAAQKNLRYNPKLLAQGIHWVNKPKEVFISWDGVSPDWRVLRRLEDDVAYTGSDAE